MTRDFNEWLSQFRISIADYGYYVDFDKVYRNVDEIRVELNILNSLIGSQNIEQDFEDIAYRYPETLKCLPILLAVRYNEIYATDKEGLVKYDFKTFGDDVEHYKTYMRKTGLFDLLSNHLINNLIDYVTGVEVGLDSNGRKNRGGHLMEHLVEKYIKETGAEYYSEMYADEIERRWGVDLSPITNNGQTRKRFDFVIKTDKEVFGVETNFYGGTGGGSKLNETARSYKMIAQEAEEIDGFTFLWLTDGTAWNSARGNLQETFETTRNVYCIVELEDGILNDLIEGTE